MVNIYDSRQWQSFEMETSETGGKAEDPNPQPGPKRKVEDSAPHPEKPAVGKYRTHQQR